MMKDDKNINFTEMKIELDGVEVDFVIEKLVEEPVDRKLDFRFHSTTEKLAEIQKELDLNDIYTCDLDNKMEKHMNHSDLLDYQISVASGILAGIIDSLWVGEFSLKRGRNWGKERVNEFVKKTANLFGYDGDSLEGAIRHLEKKYGLASDSVTGDFGGSLQHHLRDFAHHPTLLGLAFSMLTQFSGKAFGTDVLGNFIIVDIEDNTLIGQDLPQKFLFGTVFWFFHMVSDMAGSSSSPGAGTGLPGPLVSFMKEISSLPFFSNLRNENGVKKFSHWISRLYNGTMLSDHDESGNIIRTSAQEMRFDLRAEIGVFEETSRQSIPIVINECMVRGFYFIRRLEIEIKDQHIKGIKDLNLVNWNKVKPTRNRTITRMLTIATGTMSVIDIIDAGTRSVINNNGINAGFLGDFILRVNVVGVGRFTVALSQDISSGLKRNKNQVEIKMMLSERLHLLNAKIHYIQAESWIAAESTETALRQIFKLMELSSEIYVQSLVMNQESLKSISKYHDDITVKNEGLVDDIKAILGGDHTNE